MNWKRIVVKVGTSTVCHPNGAPNLRRLDALCRVLSDLKNTGYEMILVSSGAIGVGTHKMGLDRRPPSISGRQAAAAIGQCELMSVYDRIFMSYGLMAAQLLLTKDVTENPISRSHAVATFAALLQQNVIPIVNENDSIATEEIVYGDNDTLSAVVAQLSEADLLVLLSDIDGLYTADPSKDPEAKIIPVVTEIDPVRKLAGDSHTKQGTGGMITKIHAADIAVSNGISMIIASGRNPEILYDITDGKQTGTLFVPGEQNEAH